MSDDELVPALVEGTVLDDRPFTDRGEAQEFMSRTLALLHQGIAMQQQADYLLNIGARREVWKVLGFESWEECLVQNIAETLAVSVTLTPEARMPLVASLRKQLGNNTQAIADAVGVHSTTVLRDLRSGRASGLLEDEPQRVVGNDGRSRPVTATNRPRRPFKEKWGRTVYDAVKMTTTFRNMRDDDRYPTHMPDLVGTCSDLARLHEVLGQILQDFKIVPPIIQDSEI